VKVGSKHLAPASTLTRGTDPSQTSIRGKSKSDDKQETDDAAWVREQTELKASWKQAAAAKSPQGAAEKILSDDEVVLQVMDNLRDARDCWMLRNREAVERQALEAKWARTVQHEQFCRSTRVLAENNRRLLPGSEDLLLQAELQAMAADIRAIADSAAAVRCE
jgi:hypothetical protein